MSDRLSILVLKILFAPPKPIDHFVKEKAAILVKLRTLTLNGKWFEAYTELAAVNAALWHAEDDLRAYREHCAKGEEYGVEPQRLRDLAFRIQELNDRRAACIAQINREAGDGGGEEKL